MKMKNKIMAFILCCQSYISAAGVNQPHSHSLTRLIKAAMQHQPSVKIAYYETERKKGDLQTAKSALYPTLDYSAAGTGIKKQSSDSEKNIENKVSVAYRVTDFGVRSATIRRAEYEKEGSHFDYAKSQNSVAQEVSDSYLNINKYKEILEGIVKEKAFYKKMLDNFSLLVSSGVALESDLRKVQVSIDSLNSREIMYQSMLDSEMFKLKNMTGLRSLSSEQVGQPHILLERYAFISDRAKMMQKIKLFNHDYHILLQSQNAALEEMNGAHSSYFPAVDLSAEYVDNHPLGNTDRNTYKNEGRVKLNVSLNLFNGFKNSAQDLKVSSAYTQSKLRIEEFLLKAQFEINNMISQYAAAKETYVVNQRSYENALQLSTLYEKEFDLGQKTLLDLISSRGEYFQSFINMIESEYSQRQAKSRQLGLMSQLTNYLGVSQTPQAEK
ncbi:TolC family protein [Candidatus Williamhamiltonella defendens]|uniref:TolC family protein n=1 Tax=Candidatus Williamhamiltonella defendens TaxID=138072 RepID=UPI0015826F5A